MTKEEAKEFYSILQAYAEGKVIECRRKTSTMESADTPNGWTEIKEIEFWNNTEYRIKPEPIYRPFKSAQECIDELKKHEPFGWVKYADDELYDNIQFVNDDTDDDGNVVKGREAHNVRTVNGGNRDFGYYFEFYTFLDGTPFGIKVEDKEDSHE